MTQTIVKRHPARGTLVILDRTLTRFDWERIARILSYVRAVDKDDDYAACAKALCVDGYRSEVVPF